MEACGNTQPTNGCFDELVPSERHLFPIFYKNYKPGVSNPLGLKRLQVFPDESPRKRAKKSLLGKTEPPGMCQSVLDAGQKEIGPRLCLDCGLLYSPGEFQDEEEHRKAHERMNNVFTMKLWKNAQIVHSFLDGGTVVLVTEEQRRFLSRLRDFTSWVDSELGAKNSEVLSGNSNSRLFLYVVPTKRKNQVRILGSVTMEIIDSTKVAAYKLQKPIAPNSEESALASFSCNVSTMKLFVGISRLWTDEKFRRRGIGSRLCDMVRFHSGIPGVIVPKDKIGILEPSESGKSFMYKYTEGTGGIYTYN